MSESRKYGYTQALQPMETHESVKYVLNTMIDALQAEADGEGFLLDWPRVQINTEQEEFYENNLAALRQRPRELNVLTITVRGIKE